LDTDHLERARPNQSEADRAGRCPGDQQSLIELPFWPGDDSTLVTGINDRGEVVGTSMNVRVEDELFGVPVLWTVRGRTICALPELPARVFGVNKPGQIVGHSDLFLPTVYGVGWSRR